MQRIYELLDEVEKAEGPRILVTIGTGPKIFHSGFSLDLWKQNPMFITDTAVILQQKLLPKIIKLNCPTMCVMNGHAVAGGLMFALCHDVRIISTKGKIWLSEINY